MTNSIFLTPPSWISSPSHLKNVLDHQLSSPHDVESFSTLTDTTLLCSGLKQAAYWRKKLSPSITTSTAVFSLLGPQGLALPNVTEVFEALKGLCNLLNVTEIYKSPNSSFIGISFSNPADVLKIHSNFSFYKDFIVYHVKPASCHVYDFKLLWLPPLFSTDKIHSLFHTFSSKHSFTHQFQKVNSDIIVPTNAICGSFELLPQVSIHDLPHLIPLPSPHLGYALFIVSGRPSLCLKCQQEGHLRRTCPSTRCLSCNNFHLSSSRCPSKSYSSAVSPTVYWPDDIDVDDSPTNLLPSIATPIVISSSPQSPTSPKFSHLHFDASAIEQQDASNTTSLLNSSPQDCAPTQPISTSFTTASPIITSPPSSDLLTASTHVSSLTSQGINPSSHLSSTALSPPSSHSATLSTKRITRSMTSQLHSTHCRDSTSDAPCSNIASKPSLYDVLSDEADSSDIDSPACSTADPLDVAMDPHSSLSDCSLSVRSRSPLHRTDSDHVSGEDSKSPSPRRSRKKAKVTSSTHSSSLGSHRNLTVDSSNKNWVEQVDDALLVGASHNIDPPSQPPDISPVLELSSPSASSVIPVSPGLIYSYCLLTCLHCELSTRERWPLRRAHVCNGCKSDFVVPFQKRFFPHPNKAKISLALSSNDYNDSSSTDYLNMILKEGVSVVPILWVKPERTISMPSQKEKEK